MKTWLITDTHFWHKFLWEKGHRPEDYTDQIIANWSRMVGPKDLVFHLGDIAFAHRSRHKPTLQALPGHKILIRGNHDHESLPWYLEAGFVAVCDSLVWKGVYLSHAPVEKLPSDARINIHGHLHDDQHRITADMPWYPQPWHKLLALEYVGYKPVLWEEFVNADTNTVAGDGGVRSETSCSCSAHRL